MIGLEVDARWDGSLAILALRGEARLETVSRFETRVQEALERGAGDLLLDLGRLSFMDSASAGSLLRAQADLEARGGKLVLFGMQRVIQRLVERAGLGDRFLTAADEDAARARLGE